MIAQSLVMALVVYKYKKNITINYRKFRNFRRLIMGLLIDTPFKIKIFGDKSLSKRDFERISNPLSKFGVNFKLKIKKI